jgi:hypothetical protein
LKEQELLGHMLDLARRMEIEVRTEPGPFRDGSCRLHDRRMIVLNRNSSTQRKLSAVGGALCACDLKGTFLLPAVREAIERARTNGAAGDVCAEQENIGLIQGETPSQPSLGRSDA